MSLLSVKALFLQYNLFYCVKPKSRGVVKPQIVLLAGVFTSVVGAKLCLAKQTITTGVVKPLTASLAGVGKAVIVLLPGLPTPFDTFYYLKGKEF